MYAELLELSKDDAIPVESALPQDLQTNWIALSPIPKGKRCLAVAHFSHGNPSAGKSFYLMTADLNIRANSPNDPTFSSQRQSDT